MIFSYQILNLTIQFKHFFLLHTFHFIHCTFSFYHIIFYFLCQFIYYFRLFFLTFFQIFNLPSKFFNFILIGFSGILQVSINTIIFTTKTLILSLPIKTNMYIRIVVSFIYQIPSFYAQYFITKLQAIKYKK